MSQVDEFDLIEPVTIVPPGAIGLRLLEAVRGRSIVMDSFNPVEGKCAWCGEVDIPPRRKKYCSKPCQDSAYFHCYPNNAGCKMWLLIQKQSCACAGCGVSFEDEIRRRINVTLKRYRDWGYSDRSVNYHSIGDNTGDLHQVDHIIPISKGGRGVGLDNLQVLCTECHRRKSAAERRR